MTFGNLYFSKIIKLVRLKGYVEGFHIFYLITFAFSQKNLALLQFKPNMEMHSHTFNQLCILKRSASKYALNFYLFTHLCNWKKCSFFESKISVIYIYELLKTNLLKCHCSQNVILKFQIGMQLRLFFSTTNK